MFTDRAALTSRAYADHGERVAAEVDRQGVFRIRNQVGLFTCR